MPHKDPLPASRPPCAMHSVDRGTGPPSLGKSDGSRAQAGAGQGAATPHPTGQSKLSHCSSRPSVLPHPGPPPGSLTQLGHPEPPTSPIHAPQSSPCHGPHGGPCEYPPRSPQGTPMPAPCIPPHLLDALPPGTVIINDPGSSAPIILLPDGTLLPPPPPDGTGMASASAAHARAHAHAGGHPHCSQDPGAGPARLPPRHHAATPGACGPAGKKDPQVQQQPLSRGSGLSSREAYPGGHGQPHASRKRDAATSATAPAVAVPPRPVIAADAYSSGAYSQHLNRGGVPGLPLLMPQHLPTSDPAYSPKRIRPGGTYS